MIKDYQKVSYRDNTEPPRYAELEKVLAPLTQDMAFRFSYNGVPHLLAEVNNMVYSICYFGGHNSWRVFYPYQGGKVKQSKEDFHSIDEIAEFFKARKK